MPGVNLWAPHTCTPSAHAPTHENLSTHMHLHTMCWENSSVSKVFATRKHEDPHSILSTHAKAKLGSAASNFCAGEVERELSPAPLGWGANPRSHMVVHNHP